MEKSKIHLRTQALGVFGSLIVFGSPAHAAIVSPYVVDSNTLHLWHFDEEDPGPAVPATGVTGSFDLVPDGGKTGTPSTLGAEAYTGFGLAGDTTPGSGAGFKGDAIPLTSVTGVDGAFTFEGIVRTANMTDLQQLLSMEGNANANQRPFQFRIANGELVFINISGGLAGGGDVLNQKAAIPGEGPHAFVANEWFHFAATYNGDEISGTENFKLYWTRVDTGVTSANEIGSSIMPADLLGDTLGFGVGNDYRTSGTGNTSNFEGQIDEVRISDIARGPGDMLFGNSSGGSGLEITQIDFSPSTSLLTLTWRKSGAGPYSIFFSHDLVDWDGELVDGITDASDENPGDSDQITSTVDLNDAAIGNEDRLFFRVQAGR